VLTQKCMKLTGSASRDRLITITKLEGSVKEAANHRLRNNFSSKAAVTMIFILWLQANIFRNLSPVQVQY
jgi:hypothetical protein